MRNKFLSFLVATDNMNLPGAARIGITNAIELFSSTSLSMEYYTTPIAHIYQHIFGGVWLPGHTTIFIYFKHTRESIIQHYKPN